MGVHRGNSAYPRLVWYFCHFGHPGGRGPCPPHVTGGGRCFLSWMSFSILFGKMKTKTCTRGWGQGKEDGAQGLGGGPGLSQHAGASPVAPSRHGPTPPANCAPTSRPALASPHSGPCPPTYLTAPSQHLAHAAAPLRCTASPSTQRPAQGRRTRWSLRGVKD